MAFKPYTLIKSFTLFSALFLAHNVQAIPLEVHGVFGADMNLIDTFRRIDRPKSNTAGTVGSQEVALAPGEHANASFQTYIFRMNPELVVNDSVTIHSEITTGYNRGGFFGDSSENNLEDTNGTNNFGNSLYLYNQTNNSDSLYFNKAYMELYSDTATYLIGRHSYHWALGAIYHDGNGTWDRHTNTRDGVTLKIKLGSFYITPYWAKINYNGSLTRATRVKEYGFSLLYDNIDRDIAFGILYAKKQNAAYNSSEETNITGSKTQLGLTDVKITDLYLKKAFGNFEFAIEFPFVSGEIGYLYNSGTKAKYKAKAIIAESNYQISNSWKVGFNMGRVSGDDGGQSSFDAMFLNPNYQIANLLYRYNLNAVSSPNSVGAHDTYITNSNFYKLYGSYSSDKWTWDAAWIIAWADETAIKDQSAYDHDKNQTYTALDNQDDFLGHEIDLGFEYHWNSEVDVGGSLGYLFTGDYYGFTNDPNNKNEAKNSFALQLRSAVRF